MNQILAKQGKWFLAVSFVAIILGSSFAFASPPAPSPMCHIEGVIKSVEFKVAYDEACLKEPYGCPTDMNPHHPAQYFLDININSVSYASGDTSISTCQNIYPVGKTQKFVINKDNVKSGDTFSVNQKIDGIVLYSGFRSYTLGATTQQKYVQNLYFGLKNSLVSTLQSDLSADSSIYPEKLVTGYFGSLTLKAVKRFQAKYGISQTGYVGPLTRAKLNEMYTSNNQLTCVLINGTVGNVLINSPATFSASGGNGVYSWAAPGGRPSSGTGNQFSTIPPTTGIFTVTVTSEALSATCNASIVAP